MKEYICVKCNKKFNQKIHYTDHINRKTPCNNDTTINIESLITKIDKMEKEMKKLKRENEKMHVIEKDMKALKKEMDKIKTVSSVANNTQNIETVNILLLNGYGKEDLTHLTSNDIRAILNQGFQSIPKYIEYVHFNENAPQNKNICISNRRDSTVNVYNGKKWTLKDKAEFLNDIREKGIDFIEKNIDDLNEKNPEDKKILNKINRFIKKYRENDDDEDDNNYFKKVNKDIQLILYNNRDKVIKAK